MCEWQVVRAKGEQFHCLAHQINQQLGKRQDDDDEEEEEAMENDVAVISECMWRQFGCFLAVL